MISKEFNPKMIAIRSHQLPSILNQVSGVFPKNPSPTTCPSENGGDSQPSVKLSENFNHTGRSNSMSNISKQKDSFIITSNCKENLEETLNQKINNSQKDVGSSKINKDNKRNLFKSQSGLDYSEGMPKKTFLQQSRLYHKKAEKPAEGFKQGTSTGILSKEALLNHHAQINVSHFSLFDPDLTALNLSALQPSKAGFNVRKLISKTHKDNWDWGLPSELSQVKTEGPKINENLIDFVVQKMKIQTETKKKFKPAEEQAKTQIRSLMNKARSMNKEAEKLRIAASVPPEKKEKRLYRTVSSIVNSNSKHSRERPVKTGVEKAFQRKHSAMINENSNLRERETEGIPENKNNIDEPSKTAYQPTASYRDLFYNILNKPRKKPKLDNSLSVFNRPALEIGRAVPKRANQSTLSNVSSYISARGKSEKQLDSENKKSQTSGNSSSMKDVARTPFQKVKDSLFTKSAKASFSTISKTKLNTNNMLSNKKGKTKQFSTYSIPKVVKKDNKTTPKISTMNYQKRNKSTTNAANKKVNKRIFKASSKQTKNEGNILEQKDSKIFSKANKQAKTNEFNKQPTRTFFSYHGPNTSMHYKKMNNTDSFIKSIPKKESSTTEKARAINKSFSKRTFHTQNNGTIFQPIEEKVFYELLNLCDSSKNDGEPKRKMQSTKQSFEDSCRCSLNEKKTPEKKKGIVCRIASMLNIGCGSGCKCPPRGCPKCGKF